MKQYLTDQNYNSSITKFTISPLKEPKNSVVAVASATFYDTLTVYGITINKGKNGLYVKMPQKKTQKGNYIDVVHPLSPEGRKNINDTLLQAYQKSEFKKENVVVAPNTPIKAQNVVKYPEDYGNKLARCDLIVIDMVVHNVNIINVNDKPKLYMPSYKTKNGSFTSICVPTDKKAYGEMKNAALTEYNTNYTYRKYSDADVEKLKASSEVNIQSHKNNNGENIVKFKTDDLQKVHAIVYNNKAVASK